MGPTINWLSLNIEGSTFDKNIGKYTNDIYFDDSLASINISADENKNRTTWKIDDSFVSNFQLAKVLYKPPTSVATISVSNTDFTCQSTYNRLTIMGQNEAAVQHNKALFHLE